VNEVEIYERIKKSDDPFKEIAKIMAENSANSQKKQKPGFFNKS